MKCKQCNINFKTLTREILCAFCHKEKYKEWSKKFTDIGNKHSDGEN